MLQITAIYAGLLGLILVKLSAEVSLMRFKGGISIGDGDDKATAYAIRRHANFIEYTPITLILIAIMELQGAPSAIVHGAGIVLVATRLGHYIGHGRRGLIKIRQAAMALCYLQLLALSLGVLGHGLL